MEQQEKSERLLLVTNVERGEANIFLAVSRALLQVKNDVELHFASFIELEESVESVWREVCRQKPNAKRITFHKIEGPSMTIGLREHLVKQDIPLEDDYLPKSFLASPSLFNTLRAIRDTVPIFIPYSGPQLLEVFESIVDIIRKVAANLVVVDTLMTPALTACSHVGIRYICLSPNAIKEFAASSQPSAASLWKYPALFSGFAYPVPWHLMPLNAFFILYTVNKYLKDKHLHNVARYLLTQSGARLKTPVDLIRGREAGLRILVSTLPELDFNLRIPSHVFPCGPVLLQTMPLSEVDPQLSEWLHKGSTIYINLGTICKLTEERTLELARGLKIVIDVFKISKSVELQVLWKLKKCGEYKVAEHDSRIHQALREEMQADRVRIVDWISSEPLALLQTGKVICAIHHGGANSFNECIVAGVPQVVLPQWTDCYDYAQRVDMLGVGRCGNKTKKPLWSAEELSCALNEVLTSDIMKKKATELSKMCQRNGSGAENAARIILEMVKHQDLE